MKEVLLADYDPKDVHSWPRSSVVRRNMKMKLAVGFAILLFSTLARADQVQTGVGPVFIPDGGVVTSDQQVPGEIPYTYIVDFTFADGSGSALTEGIDSTGTINFTTPVADLSFSGIGVFWLTDNLGDSFVCEDLDNADCDSGSFAGPGITSVGWQAVGAGSEIESMNYTLNGPAAMPESSSLLLLGTGLATLIGLARHRRTKGHKAIA